MFSHKHRLPPSTGRTIALAIRTNGRLWPLASPKSFTGATVTSP